jgi:hypothetical protein
VQIDPRILVISCYEAPIIAKPIITLVIMFEFNIVVRDRKIEGEGEHNHVREVWTLLGCPVGSQD